MTSQKIVIMPATAIFVAVFLLFNTMNSQGIKSKPWPVPDKDKTTKALIKLSDPAVITTGKALWGKHCKLCHGNQGMGDGPRAASLKDFPGDFSSPVFQANTDGEIFYRINKGRDEMPGYEKNIPGATDRWALVAFIRTLKK